MRSGTYTVGPDGGSLLVRTARSGAAARIGHDLVLEAQRWSATFTVDAASIGSTTVEAEVDAASLVVRDASGGALPLTAGQRQEIGRTIREKVLRADRHPAITAHSTSVEGSRDEARVQLELTLAGRTRTVTMHVTVAERGDGPTAVGSATIVQTQFGITPYSAMLGALRVRDEVEVTVEVRLPAG